MSRLSHEQFDHKVEGLAATYSTLREFDLTPEGLTGGEFDNTVLYGFHGKIYGTDTFSLDLTRGVREGLERLRFDVGCWGRLTHDSSLLIDEVGADERLEMAGILAMMTAPKDQERFNEVALTVYELLDNVVQGNRVVVERPGEHRYVDGEWQDDVQESGQHNGKLRVTFENGHISSRAISIWSDRPEDIHSETADERGFHNQVVFPLLTVDLEALANGKVQIKYPSTVDASV